MDASSTLYTEQSSRPDRNPFPEHDGIPATSEFSEGPAHATAGLVTCWATSFHAARVH